MLFISPFRVREITNLTTTPLPSRNEKFISPKQTQSSRRDIKSLEDSETQQSKKLTSLDKRSVELQVRSETGDGDHESGIWVKTPARTSAPSCIKVLIDTL